MKHSLLVVSLLLMVGWGAGQRLGRTADEAAAHSSPPEKAIAVDVRSASLADVLARMAEASGVTMASPGSDGNQRVTLHAGRTTAGEMRQALEDLLRLQVHSSDTDPRYSFAEEPAFTGQVKTWRRQQAEAFLTALSRMASDFQNGREAEAVQATRERFRSEHPEFTPAMLAPLTPDYFRQALLVTALSPAMRRTLVQAGWLSLPLAWVSPPSQALLGAFAQSGPGAAVPVDGDPATGEPGARVEYRLLYGDRWTDRMLLVQIGAPGEWSTAMLPFMLFRQQDDSALYPAAADRPDDPDVWRRLPPHFDTAGKDWDTVLDELARTMEIKLAADSYARPALFHTDRALPDVAGIPLRDALDRLCQEHGYFWWKQDGWYLLRSRTWTQESRVAVPDRLLQRWVESVKAHHALTEPDLFRLATLSDEQLLTLGLESRPPGSAEFMGTGFNPNEASLLAEGLLLFRSLPAEEREMALGDGVPALALPPAPQKLFEAVAGERGVPMLPDTFPSWSFRVRQSFSSGKSGSHSPVSGEVSIEWQLGATNTSHTAVSISDRSLHPTEEPANPSNVR